MGSTPAISKSNSSSQYSPEMILTLGRWKVPTACNQRGAEAKNRFQPRLQIQASLEKKDWRKAEKKEK